MGAEDLDRALAALTIVELDPSVARAAGDVSERFALRAHDAEHLASALVVDEGDTVVVTWIARSRTRLELPGWASLRAKLRA